MEKQQIIYVKGVDSMKLRYIICFFSFICIFTFTYYISYGLLVRQPETGTQQAQEPTLSAEPVQESYAVQAAEKDETGEEEDQNQPAVPVQESPASPEETYAFFITAEDGTITVYEGDGQTVYLHTNIDIRPLPESEQHKLLKGFFVPSEVELFDYLENYTS